MAELIPTEEITELKDASVVAEVAKEAVSIIEKQTVAALINTAANAGEHSVIWNRIMSDELQNTLESHGYKITKNLHAADPEIGAKIWGW